MKNFKLVMIAIGMLSITACEKRDEDLNTQSSEKQQLHSLGAKLIDQTTYNNFAKVNINELTLRLKGKTEKAAKNALASSYLIPGLPAIGDQGAEGSCVAWATAYTTASGLESNFKGVTAKRSPEYVYNQIKLGSCDAGAYVSDGLNLIKNQGVCSWAEMPYTDTGCSTQPNSSQKNAASTHKFTTWATVDKTDISNVKTLLSMNLPIVIAVTVDYSFDHLSSSNGWIWKSHSGSSRGGHAIAVIGYDDAKQAFKVQNQWGTNWGNNGYFWIDYSFFAKTTNGAINECYVAYVQ
ncbi:MULTISPECIES: C1 family peptidase [Chryseobacterium]|uniref:C1 family peptidase n=1 Tax=Chryseobacterium TaxID=59732 RepID=UPI0015539893|nr:MULTISPECIES: C1 family peptidase [unclassified Chryseobacterium]MDC8106005.1 C1 family peptidase [Chryseobacterium sp. B21-037]MDQ1804509.1 C1 family peptidase [Chryseobacterium sp. CKR4-1]WBV55217.1 C1 family peptidase [Chryseobacterium daecheongense]